MADDVFADVLTANASYAETFQASGLDGRAAKHLAVLTCMDSRIDPLGMLGMSIGDVKLLRNAGARVTDDVLRTLVLAAYLLDVTRVMVVAHTRCAMAGSSEADIHDRIAGAGGPDTHSLHFLPAQDQEEALRSDVHRIRSWPYLRGIEVGGFRYDVDTGRIERIC